MKVFLAILGIIALYQVTEAVECHTSSDCNADECCAKRNGPLILSKRQLIGAIQPSVDTVGTCRRYNLEGEHCSIFDKPNGFCGCAAGLQCTYVKTSLRSAPAFPGFFHCSKN